MSPDEEFAILHPSQVSPECIGPNTKTQAQIANFLSHQKSRKWIEKNHVRVRSNETDISIGRRTIGRWHKDESPNEETPKNEEVDSTFTYDRVASLPENFVDQIAHLTKSSCLLSQKDRRGDVLYEKQRFHDLKQREKLANSLLEMEKEIQSMNNQIAFLNSTTAHLSSNLDLKMRKRDCLDLLIGELIFQIQVYTDRQIEADKITAQVTQAVSNAARKAKINRVSAVKGSMLGKFSDGQGSVLGLSARTRGSRAAGLNTAKGSQFLDRVSSKTAINVAERSYANIANS